MISECWDTLSHMGSQGLNDGKMQDVDDAKELKSGERDVQITG